MRRGSEREGERGREGERERGRGKNLFLWILTKI